jgi:rare lipoprotein A
MKGYRIQAVILSLTLILMSASLSAQSNIYDSSKYSDRDEIIFTDKKYSRQDESPSNNAGNSNRETLREEKSTSDQGKVESSKAYSSERFYQTGIASWYGREFHGKVTASGEKFDMYQLTAAHKTLPFGTIITVKNLENGKSIRVRINDRGPYRGNRILDLSFDAAKELGILQPGKAMVGIRILGNSTKTVQKEQKLQRVDPVVDNSDDVEEIKKEENIEPVRYSKTWSIQAGAFYSKRNAFKLTKRLEAMFNERVVVVKDGDLYKVRMKGIISKTRASSYTKELKKKGIGSFIMK